MMSSQFDLGLILKILNFSLLLFIELFGFQNYENYKDENLNKEMGQAMGGGQLTPTWFEFFFFFQFYMHLSLTKNLYSLEKLIILAFSNRIAALFEWVYVGIFMCE